MGLQRVSEHELDINAFSEIGKQWMLITAGSVDDYNTMTASWGTLGVLWGRSVAICFVRPTRHTYQFMERQEHFTLSFFPTEFHSALVYCGSHSGRDVDKAAETGLSPIAAASGNDAIEGGIEAVTFAEARLVFVCRKLYADVFEPAHFTDKAVDQEIYPKRDHHTMYVGEIISCLRSAE
jgi:flavin reductase (DIM6/NTAB) family NADH-FMN oxidoreductase RutF